MLLRYNGAVYRYAESSFEDQARAKSRFLFTARKRFQKLILSNVDALMALAAKAAKAHPEDAKKRSAALRRDIGQLPAVQEYVKLTNQRKAKAVTTYILDRIVDVVLLGKPLDAVVGTLSSFLDTSYVQHKQEQARKPMMGAGLPEEVIKQLLPKSFSFQVSPNGELINELSVFGNKAKTEMAKTAAMARLLAKWNDLVDVLNTDLKSNDPFTRLCAIAASIIVHTGIRPGTEGESRKKDLEGKIIKDENGKPIKVKTVGATGLRKEHVKFIRDDFIRLQFPGKAATWNVADLTDADLIEALKAHINLAHADRGEEDSIFVTKSGRKISDRDVNAYLKNIIGEHISATDFRKLKATREFYNSLRLRKSELAAELRKLKAKAKREMRDKIVRTVVTHILGSAAAAQKAISHSDVRVTIESYISPRVVLEYLSNAGLNRKLEEVVSSSHGMRVRFDPMDFYNTMVVKENKTAALRTGATTFEPAEAFSSVDIDEIIEELEE